MRKKRDEACVSSLSIPCSLDRDRELSYWSAGWRVRESLGGIEGCWDGIWGIQPPSSGRLKQNGSLDGDWDTKSSTLRSFFRAVRMDGVLVLVPMSSNLVGASAVGLVLNRLLDFSFLFSGGRRDTFSLNVVEEKRGERN